ncbi:MAG: hypothetical protein OER04_03715 [Cyclobacteriaceae bacterium]|nr:hypothetical protein [Cyclobacteriaceae bacterium]
MRNLVLIGLGLAVVAGMFSCKSNHICPSFESAYILDQEIRDQTFSLFDVDTLPKEDFIVRKDKNGIIKSVKYKRKRDEMLTVKMETIFPQVDPPDTMLLAEQDLTPEQIEQILSEGEQPINHYNVDQIYYMRHFGQYLPMPEEPGTRIVDEEGLDDDIIPLEEPKVKKRKKWQFWKKKEPVVEESDSIDYGFEQEADPFEDFDDDQVDKEKLGKKELRQLEQQEKEEEEEEQRLREPTVIDLDDFEKNRGDPQAPTEDEGLFKKKKNKKAKPKGEKKIKIGFGKKKKKTESVELIEDEEQKRP